MGISIRLTLNQVEKIFSQNKKTLLGLLGQIYYIDCPKTFQTLKLDQTFISMKENSDCYFLANKRQENAGIYEKQISMETMEFIESISGFEEKLEKIEEERRLQEEKKLENEQADYNEMYDKSMQEHGETEVEKTENDTIISEENKPTEEIIEETEVATDEKCIITEEEKKDVADVNEETLLDKMEMEKEIELENMKNSLIEEAKSHTLLEKEENMKIWKER